MSSSIYRSDSPMPSSGAWSASWLDATHRRPCQALKSHPSRLHPSDGEFARKGAQRPKQFPENPAVQTSGEIQTICERSRKVEIFHDVSCARDIALVRLLRPVNIIDPPAAIRADQREARAVISVVGAMEIDFQGDAGTADRRRFGAHHVRVKHPPVLDEQLVPGIKGNLPAVARRKHIVGGAQFAAIECAKLRAN